MASLTRKELMAALEQLLPPLDPTTVKFSTVMEELARHFGVDKRELKAKHKDELKQIIPDMIHLCTGGENKENEPRSDNDDEEEVVPAKKQSTKRSRGHRIQESDDEEEGGDDDDDEEDAESGGSDDDEDDEERQPKRRKKAPSMSKRETAAKRKAPVARKPADKSKDSEGLAAFKELARVAGLLSPAVYAILKKQGSEEEQEDVLRERLQDAGVRFSSPYPKKSDIAAAKRKRDKEKELDGIDTSLIITGGRSRRSSARQAAFVTSYDDEEESEKDGEEEIHDKNEEESEANEESVASDESEAEF